MVVRMVDAMSSKQSQEGCWPSSTTDVRLSRKTIPPSEVHVPRDPEPQQHQRLISGRAGGAWATGRSSRKQHAVVDVPSSWAGVTTTGATTTGATATTTTSTTAVLSMDHPHRSVLSSSGNAVFASGVVAGGVTPSAASAPSGEGYQVGITLLDYRECAVSARGGICIAQDAADAAARMIGGADDARRQRWAQSWENGGGGSFGGDGSGAGGGGRETAGGGASSAPLRGAGLAEVLDVPREILELSSLKGVLSLEVWEKYLSEGERQYLARFLPAGVNARESVAALLAGRNLHFGNQFLTWSAALCHRELQPRVLQERAMEKKRRRRAFFADLRRYHREMVSDLREMAAVWKDCRDPDQELAQRLRVWRRKRREQKAAMAAAAEGGGEGAERQLQLSQGQQRRGGFSPALLSSSSGRVLPHPSGLRAHVDGGGGGVSASRGGGGSGDTGGRRSGDSARKGAGGGGGSAESSGDQRIGEENWRIPKEAVAAANAAALAAYAEWNRRHGNCVSGPDPAELTRVEKVNRRVMAEIIKRREAGEEVRWDSLKRLMMEKGGGEESEQEEGQQQQQLQPRELKRRKNDAEREKREKERFAQEKKRQEDHWQTLVHQDLPASQVLFMKFHREQMVIAKWVAERCADKYNARLCRKQAAAAAAAAPLLALPPPPPTPPVYL